MLNKLNARFNLRKLYSQSRLDLLNWMPSAAPREDFLHFYRKMVAVRVDRETNIVTIEVRSFDRKSARDVAEAILEMTAEYVDGLSATVRHDTVRSSEQELQKARNAVRDARLAMTLYRTSTGMLDPLMTAGATSGTINTLQQEVLQTRAEIATLLTYNTPNSPQVTQLKARISALEGQIAETQHKVDDTSRSDNLAKRLYEYEGLVVTNEYAEKQLVAALGAYDAALAVAGQRERFLVRIVNPNLPDRPAQPKRLLTFLEALLVVVAAYGIIALAIAGVRDHQGI
jgi:BexC/CtrB/KpsE family polysaccharide export inner-membrane protein